MYELNSQTFRQLLENALEDTAENDFEEVDPYLLENICFPILYGQPLIPNQIDYSRFILDDLYDLLDAVRAYCRRRYRLWTLNQDLCGQTTSQSAHRAFC